MMWSLIILIIPCILQTIFFASISLYLIGSAWLISLSFLLSYAAIYSGDYKWFESESEAESEGESVTGSPTHDRSRSPAEAEGGRGVAEEIGNKGMSPVYRKRDKKEAKKIKEKKRNRKRTLPKRRDLKINFNPEKTKAFTSYHQHVYSPLLFSIHFPVCKQEEFVW